MRAIIDKNLCTGCGLCRDLCPSVFGIDSYLAYMLVPAIPPKAEPACRKAAVQCPLAAIEILD